MAKSVGLVVKLEIDLDETNRQANPQKSVNKITINMYDKDVMPVVDDLYLNDQTAGILSMKQEGRQEEVTDIFSQFISTIENSI